jgi:hypothetical protein
MNQRILYPTDQGITIIIPAPECGLSVVEIARKDVPKDTPYLIVDVSEIPSDRTYRDAWECDFSNPDGYGIGVVAWMKEKYNIDIEEE